MQSLRTCSKSLQSWAYQRTTVATELARLLIDREASVMALPLQDPTCHQTAGEVVLLGSRGARLRAPPAVWIRTDAHDRCDVGAPVVQATDRCGRPCQAVGGIVRGAVADHQPCEPSAHPTDLGSVGGPPLPTAGVASASALLLQTAAAIPPVVSNPLQQRLRGLPGITQPLVRATAPAMTGIAEPL